MAAKGASLACISRVNNSYRDARNGCFVFDKLRKFTESPFAECLPLGLSNRRPESPQVFQGDSPLCLQGARDDIFRDDMIHMPLESSFFAGIFFKMALGVFGASLLELAFEAHCFFAYSVYGFTGEKHAVGSRGNIGNAEVNAKSAFWSKWRTIRDFNTDTKKKIIFVENKISLASDHAAMKLSICAVNDRNLEPSIHAQNTNSVQAESKNAGVIDEGRMSSEFETDGFIPAIALNNLADSANGKLSTQTKLLSNLKIAQFMEIDLAETSLFPGYIRNKITGIIKAFHCFNKRTLLVFSRKQFNFNRKFHGNMLTKIFQYVKEAALLPALKARVSAPEIL